MDRVHPRVPERPERIYCAHVQNIPWGETIKKRSWETEEEREKRDNDKYIEDR